MDDLGLVFYPGEPFTDLGLSLAARSPLEETLLVAMSNGANGYLAGPERARLGGYQVSTAQRYARLAEGTRPLPYAPEAGERLLCECLTLIDELCRKEPAARRT